MKAIDKAALELAIEMARREPDVAKQLDDKLEGTRMAEGSGWACPPERWQAVAEFAAYSCQIASLKLKPWQDPPCHGDEDGDGPADLLLQRMLAAGISRFHPDPLGALAEAAEIAASRARLGA